MNKPKILRDEEDFDLDSETSEEGIEDREAPTKQSIRRWRHRIFAIALLLLSVCFIYKALYHYVKYFNDEYVALCVVIRDQPKDLPEWLIHHYHHIGVRRFYIMDDGSTNLSCTNYSIDPATVNYLYYKKDSRKPHMQTYLYSECQRRFGYLHTWIGYIDVDEYIEMTSKNESFITFLKSFEANETVGAVGINWLIHNSNGLLTRPNSTRKAFTSCISDTENSRHIKSFVKTAYYDFSTSPHSFKTTYNTITVGENGDFIDWAWRTPITRDRVALHHYLLKSAEEFREKNQRWGGVDGTEKSWEFFYYIDAIAAFNCSSMADYNP